MCMASFIFLSFSFLRRFYSLHRREKSGKRKHPSHLNHFLSFPPLFLNGLFGMIAMEKGRREQNVSHLGL